MRKITIFILALAVLFAGCIEDGSGVSPPIDDNAVAQANDSVVPDLIEQCENKTAMERAFCYSDLAIEKDDLSMCSHVVVANDSQQRLNTDYCIAKFAFFKKDVEICYGIETSTLRDACIIDLAMNLDSPEMCNDVTDEENKYENCYMQMAEVKNDSKICDEIDNEDYSAFCSSIILREPELCDSINDSYIANSCYIRSSWDTNDWKYCTKIREDEMLHDICLAVVASHAGDEDICKNVKIPENEQNCMDEVRNADLNRDKNSN